MFLVFIIFLVHSAWTCETTECINLSNRYKEHMDLSFKPCDNFYKFTCGNYVKKRTVLSEKYQLRQMRPFEEMQEDFNDLFMKPLENPLPSNASYSLKQAKIFFDSCMNKTAQDQYRTDAIVGLPNLFGGWNILDNSKSTETVWEVLAGNLTLYGIHAIMKPSVGVSQNNSETHILTLEPPRLVFRNAETYNNSQKMEFYEEYILGMLELMGVKMENATYDMVKDIIDFEKCLGLMISQAESDSSTSMTYGEIKETYHNIKWEQFFNKEFKHPLAGIPDSLVINIPNSVYFEKLNDIITSEPPVRVHNYLMWRLVGSFVRFLSPKYRGPLERMHQQLLGTPVIHPTDRSRCVKELRQYFAVPIAVEYIRSHFTSEDKTVVERMLNDIKFALKKELEEADWMLDITKKEALKKLETMGTKLEFVDGLLPQTLDVFRYLSMDSEISKIGVDLDTRNYLGNVLWLTKYVEHDKLSRLNHKPDVDWSSILLLVNAYYNLNHNKIVLPPGVLRYPMLVHNAPLFVSYGSIGATIGHESSHAFDNQGSLYDEKGNKRNWWDDVTQERYKNRTQCFVEQYGKENDPVTGENVNSILTLGENIADNGGVRIAYQAYQHEMSIAKDTKILPNFENYTSDQMFFIAYANTFCEINTNNKQTTHAHGTFRVNVPLQNFEKFAEAFKCEVGSAMFKEEKDMCRVW